MTKIEKLRADLLRVLRYEPETGNLIWLVGGGRRVKGDVAGCVTHDVIIIGALGWRYRAHRLIWFLVTGQFLAGDIDIDHRNGDFYDNRWRNLRRASRSQNNMNSPPPRNNTSGVKGVSFNRSLSKWHARISQGGQPIILGNFGRFEDAVAARIAAERRIYGQFSKHTGV